MSLGGTNARDKPKQHPDNESSQRSHLQYLSCACPATQCGGSYTAARPTTPGRGSVVYFLPDRPPNPRLRCSSASRSSSVFGCAVRGGAWPRSTFNGGLLR